MNIDIRTVAFLSIFIYAICALFIIHLWQQNHRRFAGMSLWALNFIFQTVAFVLIFMRGIIPDWISIVLANVMIIAGAVSNLIGLELFLDKKGHRFQNYLLVVIFASFYTYYTYLQPDLAVRLFYFSLGLLIICFQACWLLFYRIRPDLRPLAFWVSIVYSAYCVVSIYRIVDYFVVEHAERYIFYPGITQAVLYVSYPVLFILMAYSLTIMVSKRLVMELVTEENKFSSAFHSAPYSIMITRLADGTMLEANEVYLELTGYNINEAIGQKTMDLHMWEKEEDRAAVVDILSKGGEVRGRDISFCKKNGESVTGLFTAVIIMINGVEHILSSIRDITERKLAEEKIQKLLQEKELLLREVHHRVKNNMYTLNSLLSLQADATEEPAVITALQDAGSRVKSMWVLYDKLYKTSDFNEVAVNEYLPSLVSEIISNFPGKDRVKIINEADDFVLNADILQLLGIIINELLTNIMKYAFTDRDDGIITVSAALKDDNVTLVVQDNGKGIPDSIDFKNSTGFGLTLVEILTKQIGGTIRIERHSGTKIILEFEK